MGQVENLRKMIERAKKRDKLERLSLINQLILLNSQSHHPVNKNRSFSFHSGSKKKKLKQHNNRDEQSGGANNRAQTSSSAYNQDSYSVDQNKEKTEK